MSTSKNLVDIWELYNSQVLNEKAPAKQATKMTTKKGPGPVDLNSPKAKDIQNKDTSGPAAADGYGDVAVDVRNPKHKKDNAYNITNLSFGENFDQNMEKTSKDKINNNMKSIFNKLYEEVMGNEDAADLAALGVDSEGQGHEGAEGEDADLTHAEIIEMLEKALAALKKHAEGESEGESEMSGETEGEAEGEAASEDNEEDADEEDNEESDDADEEDSEEEDDDMKVKKESSGAIYSVDNPVDGDGKLVSDESGKKLTKHNMIKVGDKTAKLANKGKAQYNVNNPVDGDGKEVPDSAGLAMTKHNAIEPKSKIKGRNQEFFGV